MLKLFSSVCVLKRVLLNMPVKVKRATTKFDWKHPLLCFFNITFAFICH